MAFLCTWALEERIMRFWLGWRWDHRLEKILRPSLACSNHTTSIQQPQTENDHEPIYCKWEAALQSSYKAHLYPNNRAVWRKVKSGASWRRMKQSKFQTKYPRQGYIYYFFRSQETHRHATKSSQFNKDWLVNKPFIVLSVSDNVSCNVNQTQSSEFEYANWIKGDLKTFIEHSNQKARIAAKRRLIPNFRKQTQQDLSVQIKATEVNHQKTKVVTLLYAKKYKSMHCQVHLQHYFLSHAPLVEHFWIFKRQILA